MRNAKCEMRNAECEMRNEECVFSLCEREKSVYRFADALRTDLSKK